MGITTSKNISNKIKNSLNKPNIYEVFGGQYTPLPLKYHLVLDKYYKITNGFIDNFINTRVVAYTIEDVFYKFVSKINSKLFEITYSISNRKSDFHKIIQLNLPNKPNNWKEKYDWVDYINEVHNLCYNDIAIKLVEQNVSKNRLKILKNTPHYVSVL